jgi:hypothetical protein
VLSNLSELRSPFPRTENEMVHSTTSKVVCCCKKCKGECIKQHRTAQGHYITNGRGTGADGDPNPALVWQIQQDRMGHVERPADDAAGAAGSDSDAEEPPLPELCPLFDGSQFSDHDFVAWLGFVGNKYRIPREAINDALHCASVLFGDVPNSLPKNYDQVFKLLSAYGVPLSVYDCCINDCVVFRKELGEEKTCPICNE